ncbi:MAG: hypothetical protein U0570_04865 [Phycisphaerales bacterium]
MRRSVIACAIVISPLARAQTVADSVADFSGTQGYRNWQYGYYESPLTPSGFRQMTIFNDSYWKRSNSDWSYLDSQGGHGNGVVTGGFEIWAVRRWTSPISARVRISVHAWKWNTNCGNGIVARLFVGDQQLWSAPMNYNDTVGVVHSVDRCVVPGETVDFAIDPRNSNDMCDGSNYTALISIAPPCPADFTCDGEVNDADFASFVQGYNLLLCDDPAMAPGCPADLNGDGSVDDADFVVFVSAYDKLACP